VIDIGREGSCLLMEHHTLDPYPIPREKTPLYINEPWIADKSLLEFPLQREPENKEDNIRIYVPMDLNKDAILRKLNRVIIHYGEANEANESEFQIDVSMIIAQIVIYDQVWYARHAPDNQRHSDEAVELVKAVISELENIPDGCAERFPFEMIGELRLEYLS
jgi:hypothetical protein